MNKLIALMIFAGLALPVHAFDIGGLQDQLKGLRNAGSGAPAATPTTQPGVNSLTPAEMNGGLKEARRPPGLSST